jgi:site-specific recombinase XerD
LEHEETRDLIKKVTTGENLSARQKKFAEKTHYRDIAIIILLLNTGIRVSECVGIDLNDINFELKSIKILRKGMKEQIIYFSDDVEQTLKDYIDLERKHLLLNNENEDALFISLKHCRISARSVENLVKKFASGVSAKNITPHKLRSTYGTALYNKTGDISLVASVLGHTNVNTTKAYYSETTQERIKDAMTKKPY